VPSTCVHFNVKVKVCETTHTYHEIDKQQDIQKPCECGLGSLSVVSQHIYFNTQGEIMEAVLDNGCSRIIVNP